MPPSQVLSLPPLNGVMPPSGKVMVSAPLSVVNTTIVLLSWPMSSSFFSTTPMLSSICFMPASLTPQSLPPGSPIMAAYLSDSTVVTCMRAGLYQAKNGLLVFFGSLRSRKSTTFAEISSSTVFDRSRVSGPSSLHVCLAPEPSADVHASIGRGGVRQTVVLGSTAPGTSARPGIGVFLQGGASVCWVGVLLMSGKLTPLHRIEVIEIAPEFLEAVRGRQRVDVIAEMVLAELAGVVAEIEQELGKMRRSGP